MEKEEFMQNFEKEKRKLQAEYIKRLGYLAASLDYEAWKLGLKFDFKKETFVDIEEQNS